MISKSKLPIFPRIIRLSMTTVRDMEISRLKQDQDINKVTRVKISSGDSHKDRVVFPEIYTDKWYPMVLNGRCAVTKARSMLGGITNRRERHLKIAWYKWLEDWLDVNDLRNVKFIRDESQRIIRKTKAKKKDKKRKLPEIKPIEFSVPPESIEDSSSNNSLSLPSLSPDS